MKRSTIIAFLMLLFIGKSFAQYIPEITEYRIYWEKLNAGQTMPTANLTVNENTTSLTISWQRGADNNPVAFPYAVTAHKTDVVPNTAALWSTSGATTAKAITFSAGMYACRMVEVDQAWSISNKSAAVFVSVVVNYAKVPYNVTVK